MSTVRVVTDEEVGILTGPHIWRGLAEAAHRRHYDPHGPVEYRVERRGRRWFVVGYQALLTKARDAD